MKNIIFDIETIPDYQGIEKILNIKHQDQSIDNNPESGILFQYWQHKHPEISREEAQARFLPIHLHQIVTIGLIVVDFNDSSFNLLSLKNHPEDKILKDFFNGLEKYRSPKPPQLVTWNGCRFDLPVLHYRALIHQVKAPIYWETGDRDPSFKYNNYLNRYHHRHLDLLDMLANYNYQNFISLDEISKLCSFPGKQGIGSAKIASAYAQGNLEEIGNYCEVDVINTYLIYLRYLLISGHHDLAKTNELIRQMKIWLNDNREGKFWSMIKDNIQ